MNGVWGDFFRMELMNKDLLSLMKDLPLNSEAVLKQDPKLAAAIDKLCGSRVKVVGASQLTMLPERKLEFSEVQDLFNQASSKKGTLM